MSRFTEHATRNVTPSDQDLWATPTPRADAPERDWAVVPPGPDARSTGNGFSIAGLVLGIVAFLVIPPLFGILGVVFSAIGKKKGESLSTVALVVSLVGLVVGMVLGAMVWGSMQ